jgi:hypothetical protein
MQFSRLDRGPARPEGYGRTGFLQNSEVRRWLNGVEPAWTMLDFDSFNGPPASNRAIRLEPKPYPEAEVPFYARRLSARFGAD